MAQISCDAIVVTCIDFRFQGHLKKWLNENYKDKTYDLVAFAGSTKDFHTIHRQIDISEKLHHIKEVVLIHHEDCGAYGDKGSKQKHINDLLFAKNNILKHHPKLTVKPYYLQLNGEFSKIE